MEISYEAANTKIQGLSKETNAYKILNAMLNGYTCSRIMFTMMYFSSYKLLTLIIYLMQRDMSPYYNTGQHFQKFNETKQVIINDILFSADLEKLSEVYDDSFLVPMRATERVMQVRDSHSSSQKSNGFETKERERDNDRCVLTGETDILPCQPDTKNGHQVAHFIPQSLLDDTKDGAFNWFVVMEPGPDGTTVYKAMQVEENGLLKCSNTGRFVYKDDETIVLNSSYNQPLFIGNAHPQPGEMYVRLHELMARIFKMRGQAGYYQIDSDDEYEPVYNAEFISKITYK